MTKVKTTMSIAALLAAGAALANADASVLFTTGSNISVSADGVYNLGSSFVESNGSYTLDLSDYGFSGTTLTISGTGVSFSESITDSSYTSTALSSTLSETWGVNLSDLAGNIDYSVASGSGQTLTFTFSGLVENEEYSILLLAHATNGTGTLTATGQNYTATTVASDSGTEWTSLDGNGYFYGGGPGRVTMYTFTANESGEFVVTASVPSYVATIPFIGIVSTVPEPSMFGLLAGLGALGLVAMSRRRRSRKA